MGAIATEALRFDELAAKFRGRSMRRKSASSSQSKMPRAHDIN
jgi:hypothetical protein